MYTSIKIYDNPNAESDGKRAVAELTKEDGKKKFVKFGLHQSGGTFFDGATEEKKTNYNNRHRKHEVWNKNGTGSAGFYSRWVLWEYRSVKAIKEKIKDITGISKVTVRIKKIKVTRQN